MKLPTTQRLQKIVDLLEKNGFVKAIDLSEMFSVSMETIRKDLIYLEEKGVATKEYGGASLCVTGIERNLEYRMVKEDLKKEIGRCVCDIIKEYHSMILDTGSTCLAACEYLNLLPSMDIFTNSISNYNVLNGNTHNVYLTGGLKRQKNNALVGSWAESFISSIHVDVCILGTAGLLDSNGPTSHSYRELSLKQKMIHQADFVYVLCDSSKFYEKGLHTICDWSEIDGIITDHAVSPKILDKYKKDVSIIVAGENMYGKENC